MCVDHLHEHVLQWLDKIHHSWVNFTIVGRNIHSFERIQIHWANFTLLDAISDTGRSLTFNWTHSYPLLGVSCCVGCTFSLLDEIHLLAANWISVGRSQIEKGKKMISHQLRSCHDLEEKFTLFKSETWSNSSLLACFNSVGMLF